jgi:hypothetical protein
MSQLKVNALVSYSGNTVTLGTSGDTINVASGVTFNTASATINYPAGSITNAAISSTAAIQQSKISGNPTFRNIVINGDMQIAQRSTSVASITTSGYRTVDRMYLEISSLGTWTQSQSTDVPTEQGFANSLKMDCTTANAAPAAGEFLQFTQIFEGQNLQYLKKGTASAVSLTASFWVKSTKTGTFILQLFDNNNTRSISKSYTVNVSDTWEKKTITFEGDTTGAFTNNNGASLYLNFWLGAGTDYTSGTLATTWGAAVNANAAVGQVNIADSTSNDWYITGVQLEAGTTASDFEFLPVDVNLARCLRYYQIIPDGWLFSFSSTQAQIQRGLHPNMRGAPSLTVSGAITIGTGFIGFAQSSSHIGSGSASFNKIVANLHNFTGLSTTTNPAMTYALITNNILADAEL